MPDTRIGVFVCHCGRNIGGYVDVPGVVEYAKGLPDVAHAEHNLYTCSEEGISSIKKTDPGTQPEPRPRGLLHPQDP